MYGASCCYFRVVVRNLQIIVSLKCDQHIYTAYNKRKLKLCDGYTVCRDRQCLLGFPSFYVVFNWYVEGHQGFVLAAPLWLLLQERLPLLKQFATYAPFQFCWEIRPAGVDL